ncbi:hypothetical protein TNCV_597031 [Trichonephila clavipes]|nr:hypothetical protein TNCV_597031 [Trichonephila clavipes]
MANNQSIGRHPWMLLPEVESVEKLEEGRSVTSVAAEFGIAHSIVSQLWRPSQTTGTAIRGSVVVVNEEPHPQMTGTLSYRPEEAGGRQRENRYTHDTGDWTLRRYRVLPWPEDCTVAPNVALSAIRVPLPPPNGRRLFRQCQRNFMG